LTTKVKFVVQLERWRRWKQLKSKPLWNTRWWKQLHLAHHTNPRTIDTRFML